jgi:hypothetical protein
MNAVKVASVAAFTAAAVLSLAAQMSMPAVPGILPSGFGASVDREILRSRTATEPFKSADAAVAAGYAATNECVEHQPHGGMGYHFNNDALYDTVLDPEKPEVLVYERGTDGAFRLNGVEHLVPIDKWTGAEPPTIMGQPLKKFEKLGFYYLHVWTWKANSTGVFADWNPDVKCPATS